MLLLAFMKSIKLNRHSLYIIWLFRLASKCVLSGPECVKINFGLGFTPDPHLRSLQRSYRHHSCI